MTQNQLRQTGEAKFSGRGETQKNGRQPEGAARSKINMLNVAEKPAKGKIDPTPYLLNSQDKTLLTWLEAQIAKAQNGVLTQTIQLTPTLARVLLARNPNNRTISEAIVGNYVRDMLNGAWKFNGEPIIVSKDGMLNDGQHRCMAVILSNESIEGVLVIGVERESRTTLDQGRMRSTGDYLAMTGHTDTMALSAAAKMVWQWRKYSKVSASPQFSPTKSEVLALVEETPALIRSLHAISFTNTAAAGSRSMMAFCHYAFSLTAPRGEVEMFMHGVAVGENLPGDSPILYARNRLLAEKARLKVGERAELLFRAWNCHRRGETPRAIPLQGGDLPMVES